MKALIKVGYSCNEHCTFCHTQDLREVDAASAEVEHKIRRAHELGHSMVVLSGGEATIRPELIAWARLVASLDMDFGLVTNGLMLAYDDVLEQLLSLRLRYVYMSLHGAEAHIHNRLVRRNSFDAASQALRNLSGCNLSGRKLDLTANCVVTRSNLDHLDALVRMLAPLSDVRLKFSLVEPKGGAAHLFDSVVPAVSEASRRVTAAIRLGDELTGQPWRFRHGGFPLCLMPGLEDRFDDLRTHAFRTMIEVGEPDFFPVDDNNKLSPSPVCDECSLRGSCPGLYKSYYAARGAGELSPRVQGMRSNSFDYVFETLVDEAQANPERAEDCALRRDGVTPWDRGRHLFVRHAGKLARYSASTRDFSDPEITEVKHDQGQLYLDATKGKAAPDDFARDLVKLVRAPSCSGCPEFERCTGVFEPRFEDVFSQDDAELRAVLSELRGDVLDVGCGAAPYLDTLSPAIAAGALKYTGLDPDGATLDRLALDRLVLDRLGAHQRAVQTQRGSLADVDARAQFDHILVLRSWNHLPNPRGAVDKILSLLAPGGQVVVVDNVPFGLARMPAQTRRARASSATFEHYRNDDADRAHLHLGAGGLQLVQRIDIDAKRSNQWMLRYTAAGA